MIAIGTPIGVILKFESLEDLRRVAEHLTGMAEWASTQERAKLTYTTMPDTLSKEDKEWLEKFTNDLPDAKL